MQLGGPLGRCQRRLPQLQMWHAIRWQPALAYGRSRAAAVVLVGHGRQPRLAQLRLVQQQPRMQQQQQQRVLQPLMQQLRMAQQRRQQMQAQRGQKQLCEGGKQRQHEQTRKQREQKRILQQLHSEQGKQLGVLVQMEPPRQQHQQQLGQQHGQSLTSVQPGTH